MSGTIGPDELEDLLRQHDPPRVLDVRRRSDREADPSALPGAEWRDPEKVKEWGKGLSGGRTVLYCARGGSVSRSVQEQLRSMQIDVPFLEGGLEAWKGSGKRIVRL